MSRRWLTMALSPRFSTWRRRPTYGASVEPRRSADWCATALNRRRRMRSLDATAALPLVVSRRHGDRFDVYVGRPTRWGNPFKVGRDGDLLTCVARYREWLLSKEQTSLRERACRELRAKVLACWCAPAGGIAPDNPKLLCHAQVLALVANGACADSS